MLFAYRAVNADGRLIHGRIEAINLTDLEMRLKRLDLDFVTGTPIKRPQLFSRSSVPRRELIHFCFHLEQLHRAGVPVQEGLTDLRDTLEHPRFKEVVAALVEAIDGGQTLSQAMESQRPVFDPVFVSLVHAGETTGRLPEVLANLADTLKWQDELASHTRKILAYPAFVGVVVLSATAFLMIYLVPQLKLFVKNMGQALPPQTRALFVVSDLLAHYWYLALLLPVLAATGIALAVQFVPQARQRFDAMKLRLPVVGSILRKVILSRFAATFALLYNSGIPILDSIRTTQGVVGNRAIRQGLEQAEQLIREGRNVTAAFQETGLFPPLVLRMLRIGENTGSLDQSLANVSYFYNRDVKESVEKAQALIEPLLTLILGVILGWIMLSVLGPVYDVISHLKT